VFRRRRVTDDPDYLHWASEIKIQGLETLQHERENMLGGGGLLSKRSKNVPSRKEKQIIRGGAVTIFKKDVGNRITTSHDSGPNRKKGDFSSTDLQEKRSSIPKE